jgi:hypothetical protein
MGQSNKMRARDWTSDAFLKSCLLSGPCSGSERQRMAAGEAVRGLLSRRLQRSFGLKYFRRTHALRPLLLDSSTNGKNIIINTAGKTSLA